MRSQYPLSIPDKVKEAMELARRLSFPLLPEGRPPGYQGPASACIPQVGQLLRTLAAARPGGLIVELGSGAGVGTAWLASGLAAGARLLSVELDAERAAAVAHLMGDLPQLEVRQGDWREVLAGEPPADLLFWDAGPRERLAREHWPANVALLAIGGQMVMDDLVPVELWPDEGHGQKDLKRDFAFGNPQLAAAEVRTTARTAALIMTRVA